MTATPSWSVGQEVLIRERNYGRGEARVSRRTITRIGRKYAYVGAPVGEMAFDLSDGWEKSDGSGYRARMFTPEGLEEDVRATELRLTFHQATAAYGWERNLTSSQMERILAILHEVSR